MTRFRLLFALALLLLSLAPGRAIAQDVGAALEAVQKSDARSQQILNAFPTLKDHACALHFMQCGQILNTSLTTNDCQLDDGTYVGFYVFSGQSGQTVTINMSSSAFDTFLLLLDPTPETVAVDDDGGSGTNSRIVHTLDQTSPDWTIAATSFFVQQTGPFTLRLQCSDPPDGFFSDPNYPDFRFRVTIGEVGSTINGAREDTCLEDTVCVSGQIPGRSELFIRILGPRPNGFLWPTLVRFTPSRVRVEIRQLSTNQTNTYLLDPIPPGTDLLDGLQDRTGFSP